MGGKSAVKVKIDFFVFTFILAILEAEERFLNEQRPHFMPEPIENPEPHFIYDPFLTLLARIS